MKMYLISDNADTLTGMRLAGITGVIAREKPEVKAALDQALADREIGIILITESLSRRFPEFARTIRTERKRPLFIEIPDRHGTGRRPDFITAYVNEAIGLRL